MKKIAGSLQARPRRLPRARSVRPARHRTRQGHPDAARPRRPPGRAAQAAAVQADAGRAGSHGHLRRHARAIWTTSPVNRVQEFQNEFLKYVDTQRPRPARTSLAEKKELTDGHRRAAQAGAERLQDARRGRSESGPRLSKRPKAQVSNPCHFFLHHPTVLTLTVAAEP